MHGVDDRRRIPSIKKWPVVGRVLLVGFHGPFLCVMEGPFLAAFVARRLFSLSCACSDGPLARGISDLNPLQPARRPEPRQVWPILVIDVAILLSRAKVYPSQMLCSTVFRAVRPLLFTPVARSQWLSWSTTLLRFVQRICGARVDADPGSALVMAFAMALEVSSPPKARGALAAHQAWESGLSHISSRWVRGVTRRAPVLSMVIAQRGRKSARHRTFMGWSRKTYLAADA